MLADNIELDRICQNCGSFFQDKENWEMGVCLRDEAFEPYLDNIVENEDFSSCNELFIQKCYDGSNEVCEQFEEPEFIEIAEGEDINEYIQYTLLKQQDVDEIVHYLYDSNLEIVKKVISAISTYVYIGNQDAYEGLLNYYLSLGPAENLDDVYMRKKIIDMFSRYGSERKTIEAYVYELERTPSNNTTRQLYTLVLEHLRRCDSDIVYELLIDLLSRKPFCYKIKK